MRTFNEYIESKKPKILLENDDLDDIVMFIKKTAQDGADRSSLTLTSTYRYLTHTGIKDPVKDPNFKVNYDEYFDFIKKVTVAVENNDYTSKSNYAWLQFSRIKNNLKAKKEDGTKTFKRYVSINLNDLYKAYARLPTLAKELNKVILRPEFDYLSFKIASNYNDAISHADTIVIHFYDKMAKDQVDQAVRNFLNAASVKESDRSNRQKFGLDDHQESDSWLVANTFTKKFIQRY